MSNSCRRRLQLNCFFLTFVLFPFLFLLSENIDFSFVFYFYFSLCCLAREENFVGRGYHSINCSASDEAPLIFAISVLGTRSFRRQQLGSVSFMIPHGRVEEVALPQRSGRGKGRDREVRKLDFRWLDGRCFGAR